MVSLFVYLSLNLFTLFVHFSFVGFWIRAFCEIRESRGRRKEDISLNFWIGRLFDRVEFARTKMYREIGTDNSGRI